MICSAFGCNEQLEEYTLMKQKQHPIAFRYKLCTYHRNNHGKIRDFKFKCMACGIPLLQYKVRCGDCKKELAVEYCRRYNYTKRYPKKLCAYCNKNEVSYHRSKYCSAKCNRRARYLAFRNKYRHHLDNCIMCGDPLPFHKIKYCCKSCYYGGLKLQREETKQKCFYTPYVITS